MCIRDRFPVLRRAVRAVTNSETRGLLCVIDALRDDGSKTALAVSYTHLDVYKRQVKLVNPMFGAIAHVTFGNSAEVDWYIKADDLVPVSYTHLDVYKRQIVDNLDIVERARASLERLEQCTDETVHLVMRDDKDLSLIHILHHADRYPLPGYCA